MHAELQIGSSRVMFNDAMIGQKGPKAFGVCPRRCGRSSRTATRSSESAVGAGAKEAMPMDNQFWGDRAGAVTDPAG